MDDDINLSNIPLSSLNYESRKLLSLLLNTKKILPSEGPDKLPRDWRGLASLVNISAEIAVSINECQDKTSKVLELWEQRKDGTATVGQLFQFLQRIDRYDVYDDLRELVQKGAFAEDRQQQISDGKHILTLDDVRDDLITFDDVRNGRPQFYHAYVLFAKEDKEFVDEMLRRMRADGLKLCTEEDLLPGHATQYAPVSRLISERCHRIILVLSPEFLISPASSFYTDYAQAVGIETKKPKIIPLMYRKCDLPLNLTFYHKLYYNPGQKASYDFWQKLSQSLLYIPRLNSSSSTHSSLNITELAPTSNGYITKSQPDLLALPSAVESISMNGLNTLQLDKMQLEDSKSLSNFSQSSEEKRKKPSTIRKIFSTLKGKKHKKAIMIEN